MQDLGNFFILIIYLAKFFGVFLVQKSFFPSHQDESIAMRYLNAFSIEENHQFEINAVYQTNGVFISKNEIFKVVKRLIEKHHQGPDKCPAFFSSREILVIMLY